MLRFLCGKYTLSIENSREKLAIYYLRNYLWPDETSVLSGTMEEVVEVFECDEEEQQPTEAPEISEESPEDARLRERFNALAASALSELPCDLLPIPLRAQSRAKSHTE